MCEKIRCSWAGDLPIYVEYHDQEWGRPVHEDNKLFEMLIMKYLRRCADSAKRPWQER